MRRALLAASLLAFAGTADAWVQSRTRPGGAVITWRRACPALTLRAESNPPIASSTLRTLLEEAVRVWTASTSSCMKMPVGVVDDGGTGDVENDGINLVLWRQAGFCCLDAACEVPNPKHAQDLLCQAPNAAAMTVSFYYDRPGAAIDGELIETDLELNAERFVFAADGTPQSVDLPSVLAHEVGHILGLDHVCETAFGATPLATSDGKPAPYCAPQAALAPALLEETMFPFTLPGETSRRQPEPREIDALCVIYRDHDGTCQTVSGCTASADPRIAVLALLLVGLFRRRR